MEQITKRGDTLYYGEQVCRNSDDAYCRFRDDYHASLGKRVFHRLNMPERTERIHGFRCYFDEQYRGELDAEFGSPTERIQFRFLGLVGLSYCRIIDGNSLPDFGEEDERFARWLDWFMLHAGEMMYQIGRNEKTGRTSKRLKTRYR